MQFKEAKKAYAEANGVYCINLDTVFNLTPDELIFLRMTFKEGEGFLQLQEAVPNKDFIKTLHFIYKDHYVDAAADNYYEDATDCKNVAFIQSEILRHYEYAWKIAGLMGLVTPSDTPPPLVPPTEEPETDPVLVADKLNAIARLIAKSKGFEPSTNDFDFAESQNLRAKNCYYTAKAIWCEIFGDVDPNAEFEL